VIRLSSCHCIMNISLECCVCVWVCVCVRARWEEVREKAGSERWRENKEIRESLLIHVWFLKERKRDRKEKIDEIEYTKICRRQKAKLFLLFHKEARDMVLKWPHLALYSCFVDKFESFMIIKSENKKQEKLILRHLDLFFTLR